MTKISECDCGLSDEIKNQPGLYRNAMTEKTMLLRRGLYADSLVMLPDLLDRGPIIPLGSMTRIDFRGL